MKNISDLTYYYNTQCPLHHRSAAMYFCGFLMFFFLHTGTWGYVVEKKIQHNFK
jgi:hypothetical protein